MMWPSRNKIGCLLWYTRVREQIGQKILKSKNESAMRGSSTSGQKTHTLKQVCCARQYRASSWKIKSHKKLRKTRISFRMPEFSLFLSVSTVISGLFSICHHTCMHTCVAHTHTLTHTSHSHYNWVTLTRQTTKSYTQLFWCVRVSYFESISQHRAQRVWNFPTYERQKQRQPLHSVSFQAISMEINFDDDWTKQKYAHRAQQTRSELISENGVCCRMGQTENVW